MRAAQALGDEVGAGKPESLQKLAGLLVKRWLRVRSVAHGLKGRGICHWVRCSTSKMTTLPDDCVRQSFRESTLEVTEEV